MKPRLSIIIPCYNAEGYLRHCLESVAAQLHQDWDSQLLHSRLARVPQTRLDLSSESMLG